MPIQTLIKDKVLHSAKSYDYVLPKEAHRKNLADHVFDEIDKNSVGNPDNVALVNARKGFNEDVRLSKDLQPLSKAIAKGLKKYGFKRNDVIQVG